MLHNMRTEFPNDCFRNPNFEGEGNPQTHRQRGGCMIFLKFLKSKEIMQK
jgi:hypothetical protein